MEAWWQIGSHTPLLLNLLDGFFKKESVDFRHIHGRFGYCGRNLICLLIKHYARKKKDDPYTQEYYKNLISLKKHREIFKINKLFDLDRFHYFFVNTVIWTDACTMRSASASGDSDPADLLLLEILKLSI